MSGIRSTELTEGNARTPLVYLHTETLTSGTPANGVPYSVTVKAPCIWTQLLKLEPTCRKRMKGNRNTFAFSLVNCYVFFWLIAMFFFG